MEGDARRLSSPTLIGRDDQLESLVRAATSPPSLVLVEGEAGVGKSRLVRELRARLPRRRLLAGHCHDLREPFPLGPLIEALRGTAGTLPPRRALNPVIGALREPLPELADELPPPLEPLGDARDARHRLFRAILEMLRALGPTVLVLEDLHWVDRTSYEFLGFLAAQLPAELSLVLTYRPEDASTSTPVGALAHRLPADGLVAGLSLAPLDGPDVRRLVCAILGRDDVSEELAAHLHERTLGLPFAIEEVVRLLVDRRGLARRDVRWTRPALEALEVPPILRDSILERLALLGGDARHVAEAAAVLAVPATEDLLMSVAGLTASRCREALAEALSFAVLREIARGRYGFRHTLATQAVYEAVSGPVRRELHRRAAHALRNGAEPQPLAQLARHYRQGDRPRDWVRYAELAADRALELGDDAAAFDALRDVVVDADLTPTSLGRMAVKLGRAAYTGVPDELTVQILQRALEAGGLDVAVRGELHLYLGLLLVNHEGEISRGRAELVRAVDCLERSCPALAAQAMTALGVPLSADEHLEDHLGWMERARHAARRSGDRRLEVRIAGEHAGVLMLGGDPAAWRVLDELPTEAPSFQERRRLAQSLGNFAYALVWTGHHRQAEAFVLRALELAAQAGDQHLTVSLESTRLVVHYVTGRWKGLEARAARVMNGAPPPQPTVIETRLIRALLLVAQGQLREAKHELTWVCERAGSTGSVWQLPPAGGGLARLLLAQGEAEAAREHALHAAAWIRRKGLWALAADLVPAAIDALIACGRREAAAELVDELAAGLRGRDAPAAAAALERCRGTLALVEGDMGQAARLLERAERAWMDLPCPYEAARALEARGGCLLAASSGPGVDAMLEALERYDGLGATWDAARVRQTMRRHGLVPRRRPGRKGYGNELSPREAEVARLAAKGHTNREIAAALFLSPRTVEEHVANALRKMGAHSREAFTGLDR